MEMLPDAPSEAEEPLQPTDSQVMTRYRRTRAGRAGRVAQDTRSTAGNMMNNARLQVPTITIQTAPDDYPPESPLEAIIRLPVLYTGPLLQDESVHSISGPSDPNTDHSRALFMLANAALGTASPEPES
jgi:hypothetical protein